MQCRNALCSVREASKDKVLVLCVVRPRCRGLGDRGEDDPECLFLSHSRLFLFNFDIFEFYHIVSYPYGGRRFSFLLLAAGDSIVLWFLSLT